MAWLDNSKSITSKGLTTEKSNGLAGLAARREATESQYFTPEWVARGMWEMISPAMYGTRGKISVMDNSVGTGRLIAHAEASKHHLYACDTDSRVIAALSSDADQAGIQYQFDESGMEDVKAQNMGVALINPPFSITLSSSNMTPFECTNHGNYGPNTNSIS